MSYMLHVGCRGPEVSLVQKELRRCIDPSLVVDGRFGTQTEAAVIKFQQAVGFRGRDVDGIVGPKTTLALFGMFNLTISGNLTPNPSQPSNPGSLPGTTPEPMPGAKGRHKTDPPGFNQPGPHQSHRHQELPRWFQLNGQGGLQQSARDGAGYQLQLGLVYRSRNYFRSPASANYHGVHAEIMVPGLVLGLPLPPSSTYTGQLVIQAQPITDWLVLWESLHLLTPSIGIFGQIPLSSSMTPMPGASDPATHSRVGAFLGVEFFHLDIWRDHLAIGTSGQIAGYWDFHDNRVFFDPSILFFFQGTWDFGPRQTQPRPRHNPVRIQP